MKILCINKFFYLHGGVERYFFNLSNLLSTHKHELGFFAMHHKNNLNTVWSKYFVSYKSFEKKEFKKSFQLLCRMLYSLEARNKISLLLDNFHPNIAHLRSIYHHLSPSILIELKKRNIPIIQTLGDYHVIAPNYNLYHNGSICEITKPNKYYKAINHKCVKNSYLSSFACTLEMYLHSILRIYPQLVDLFISPSIFMKNKLIEYGIDNNKIIYLHHFIDFKYYHSAKVNGKYIIYFGRLSAEKGLNFLLEVMSKLPKVRLVIVGNGPKYNSLKYKTEKNNLKNVKFAGFQEGETLKKYIRDSKYCILPSLWYENSPNCVLESFASRKPVIASNIGGIPELVKNNYNGFLFEPGSIEDCRDKILKLWNNPSLCKELGNNARENVEKYYGPENHYEKLMQIYNKVRKIKM